MQTKPAVCSAILTTLLLLPMRLSAQVDTISDRYGSMTVMGGEYTVMNNVWGATTPQCIEVRLNSTYFKVTLSGHNNGSSVAAYPAIFKGCHWGSCTTRDNPMPLPVREIESAPFTWVVKTQGVSGTWNSALDIWFAPTRTFSNNYSAEMMIWIDYHGGAMPAGSKRATVEIGGITWDLYFVAWSSWNYIAYKVTGPVDSVNLNLRDFIHDAVTRGYMYTPWYLHAIEAGFEIFSGGQGLTSNSFSSDVIRTTSPVNYPPLPFGLQLPPDGKPVDSLVVTFGWQQSVDPDLDTINYMFHLLGPKGDTTIAGLTQNSLLFDGHNYFQPNTTYTWYVEATDRIDTVRSATQRTFSTPTTAGIDLINEAPNQFYLSQNYPDPFNATTEIVFEIGTAAQVELSVFNLLGEKVKILKSGYYRSGRYQATFDASDLPSGVYYYQLETSSQSLKRKCVYMK